MKKYISSLIVTFIAFGLISCASTQPETQDTSTVKTITTNTQQRSKELSVGSSSKNIQGKKYFDWGGQCEIKKNKKKVCYIQQVLSKKNEKKPLMISVLGYGDRKKFPTAIFELPKGVDISKGIQLKIGKHKPIGFKGRCDAKGCRAGFTLDQKTFQQIQTDKRALLAFKKNGKNKPTILPISLRGVTQGLQALR